MAYGVRVRPEDVRQGIEMLKNDPETRRCNITISDGKETVTYSARKSVGYGPNRKEIRRRYPLGTVFQNTDLGVFIAP